LLSICDIKTLRARHCCDKKQLFTFSPSRFAQLSIKKQALMDNFQSPEQPVNISSVSRLALAMAFGVTLTACSSTPPDQIPSDQTAPGTSSRPILSANEAKNFVAAHYFSALTPNTAPWSPSSIACTT
jgi:hypothetical protein